MSKSNWLRNTAFGVGALTLALALWVGLSVLLLPDAPDFAEPEPHHVSEQSYRAGGAQCDPEHLSQIRSARDRQQQTDACAREADNHRREYSDLEQQWRSANAAEKTASYAFDQIRISLAESLLLFLTLLATSIAAWAAAVAARAADKSIDLARENARIELQPYVFLNAVWTEALIEDGTKYFVFSPEFKNFGATPATIIKLHWTEKWAPPNEVKDIDWGDAANMAKAVSVRVAPQAEYRADTSNKHNLAHIGHVRAGRLRHFHRFYIEYTSVFDDAPPVVEIQYAELLINDEPERAFRINHPAALPAHQIAVFRILSAKPTGSE